MKLVLIAVTHITFLLVIINNIFCQYSNNNFQQENSRTEYSPVSAVQAAGATKLLITEGSSTTEGYGVTDEYPRQLAFLFGGNYYKQNLGLIFDAGNLWTVRNVGNGGDTLTQITAQYSTQVLPFYDPFLSANYLTLQGGSNDIANGRTVAALKTDVAAYVARAKADGFLVGVCTVFHRVGNDAAKVNDYNNWLRSGNSGANFIIDLAAHPFLGDATNPTYFQGDGIHTNNAGQTIIARVFVDSIPTTAETSVGVTVSGRAVTSTGRGISNVVLSLSDAAGKTIMTRTSSFGYFNFRGVPVRQTYNITARAKRFSFRLSSQILSITDDPVSINFIAYP